MIGPLATPAPRQLSSHRPSAPGAAVEGPRPGDWGRVCWHFERDDNAGARQV